MNLNSNEPQWELNNFSFETVPVDIGSILEVFHRFNMTHKIEFTLLTRFAIEQVNRDLCNKPYPADTLSFPPGSSSEPGQVLLCPREILVYCLINKVPSTVRWTHILVHSILHTYGYAHHQLADFDKMLAMERKILAHCPVFQNYTLLDDYTYQYQAQE